MNDGRKQSLKPPNALLNFGNEAAARRSPEGDAFETYDPRAANPLPIETGVEGENNNTMPSGLE